ncbi:MAG: hypothetical protein U1F76_20595 [Candidatus Competibacteraceae bacterium]
MLNVLGSRVKVRRHSILAVSVLAVAGLVVVGAGLVGYLRQDTRRYADRVIALLRPYAEISYQGVSRTLPGSAGIDGIRLRLQDGEEIHIGSIQLQSSALFPLSAIRRAWQTGRLPRSVSVSISDLELPVGSRLLQQWLGAAMKAEGTTFSYTRCGGIKLFDPDALQAMGYRTLSIDLHVGYDLGKTPGEVILRITLKDMLSAEVVIGLVFAANPLRLQALLSTPPRLSNAVLTLVDDSLNARTNRLCAASSGLTVEHYIAAQVQFFAESLRRQGLYAGPELLAAYRRYLTAGERLELSVQPDQPIGSHELRVLTPTKIFQLLKVQFRVNGTAVKKLAVE